MERGGWEGGVGEGLGKGSGRGWGRVGGVGEGLGKGWISILQKPCLKTPLYLFPVYVTCSCNHDNMPTLVRHLRLLAASSMPHFAASQSQAFRVTRLHWYEEPH